MKRPNTRVSTLAGMMDWLRAHPREPFLTVYSGGRLLVGTRNDDGELHAWDCTVVQDAYALVPRARSSGSGRGDR